MTRQYISANQARWELAHLKQLLGWTVINVELQQDAYDRGTFWPILKMVKNGETRTVQVSQDPEGNGSGHLFIMDENGQEISPGKVLMKTTRPQVWMVDESVEIEGWVEDKEYKLIDLEDTDEN
jgi:hypothetical protein